MKAWENDKILRALGSREDPLGALVRSFPGADDATEGGPWLQSWFRDHVARLVDGGSIPSDILTASQAGGVLDQLAREPVQEDVRILSLSTRYFRGFREPECPINLDANLLVISGRNSTGKTSLTEALEWVVTGKLSRRESGYGHPRELENCITNEFCPPGTNPFVEVELSIDGERHSVRRELLEDYGSTHRSTPRTVAYLDGEELPVAADRGLFERLFAGVPPLLMQHTLRQFVHDNPENRRRYFERLLQIDELTALISKAVLGKAGVEGIDSPGGGRGWANWTALRRAVSGAFSPSILDNAAKAEDGVLRKTLEGAILQVARAEFPAAPREGALSDVVEGIKVAQKEEREKELPVLARLRPKESIPTDPDARKSLLPDAAELASAANTHRSARAAAAAISEGELAMATAVERLAEAGLVDPGLEYSTCPLCQADPPTLSSQRTQELLSLAPLREALQESEHHWARVLEGAEKALERIGSQVAAALPEFPTESAVAGEFEDGIAKIRDARELAAAPLRSLDRAIRAMQDALADPESDEDWEGLVRAIGDALERCSTVAVRYRGSVRGLETTVAAAARQDEAYRAREAWLHVAEDVQSVANDIVWERTKGQVSDLLKGIRSGLIDLRSRLIEGARDKFSSDMSKTWHLLRSDRTSAFDRLEIPPVGGRGFKLEFEVMAKLDGGDEVKEVNALKVFSESQINVVGIAAYITRARRLGHSILILDDPVQSMDEDHFNTFSSSFLADLLEDGCQVIVLTHSGTFADQISYHHYDRPSYCTLQTRRARKTGCHVEEGARRVSERLRVAEKLADQGRFDDAWVRVRWAIERTYTLVMKRADPSFEPMSWRDQGAVYMWDHGAGEVITARAPDAGPRLRQILSFAAAGPHDKPAPGETDLREAIKFLRDLTNGALRLGPG